MALTTFKTACFASTGRVKALNTFWPPPGDCHIMICCAVSLPVKEPDIEIMTGSSNWHSQKVPFDTGRYFGIFL